MVQCEAAMRIKNADKIKPVAGEVTAEKLSQFRYGNKCDPAALEAIRAMRRALYPAKLGTPCSAVEKQLFDTEREAFWNYVATNYNRRKPDGNFFRKLADATEVDEVINDPAWNCGTGEIMFRRERGLPMFTVSELHDNLRWRGFSTTRKTVQRMFKFVGVKPKPAKRGPRPGTKQKSAKQGGESLR